MLQVDTKSDAYLKCQRVSALTSCGGLTRILKSRVLLLECNSLRLLWNCGQSRVTCLAVSFGTEQHEQFGEGILEMRR